MDLSTEPMNCKEDVQKLIEQIRDEFKNGFIPKTFNLIYSECQTRYFLKVWGYSEEEIEELIKLTEEYIQNVPLP